MTTDLDMYATRLAAIKVIKDEISRVEKATRASLDKLMRPGTTWRAYIGDDDAGTVSRSKPSPGAVAVTDDAAFLAWCKTNRPEVVETFTTETVPDWARQGILKAVETTGEFPDGVDVLAPRAPVLSVRLSDEQKAVVAAAARDGRLSLPELVGGDQ